MNLYISMDKRILAAAGVVVLLVIYAYFFILNPSFVAKPNIPKTPLSSPQEIAVGHVSWLLNEVGAYKLHPSITSSELPVIESYVTDLDKRFTTTINNNYPTTTEGAAQNPDIRFVTDSAGFARLYAAADIIAEAKAMSSEKILSVEVLKDQAFLAEKGYLAIYDAIK